MRAFASCWPVLVASGLGFGMACERVPSLDAVPDAKPVHEAGPRARVISSSSTMMVTQVGSAPAEKNPDLFPLSDEQLASELNPKALTEYTGPTGAIEGVIKVTGDPPELRTFMKLPPGCERAAALHAPTYHAGPGGTLVDALVGVIGYSGYVRPSRADRLVTIKDCSLSPQVIDLSLGQRLMVANDDSVPYTPQTPFPASVRRLALKGQSPVPIFFTRPGAFGLTWLHGALPGAAVPDVTVFVIPNALHTTTGPHGRYRIAGIPVGSAWITSSHVGMEEVRQQIEVVSGKTLHVDLTMTYKRKSVPSAPSTSSSIVVPLLH